MADSNFVYWGHFIPFFFSDHSQVWSVPRVGARAWLSCPGSRLTEQSPAPRVRRSEPGEALQGAHTPAALQRGEKLWWVCVIFADIDSCVYLTGGVLHAEELCLWWVAHTRCFFCIHIKLQNKSNLIPPIMIMWDEYAEQMDAQM